MGNKPDRRAAIRAYKEMDDIGGVYRFVNTKTGWKSKPQSTPNLKGQRSRLDFAKSNISQALPTDPFMEKELQAQWKEYGGQCFEMEVLETLKRQPEQTTKEFREDLSELLSLWQEKE